MKKYYKVVKNNLKSAYIEDKRLVTQYKTGEWVTSPIPVTPLAVFTSLDSAKDFRRFVSCFNSGVKIFECEVSGRTKVPWLLGTSRLFYNGWLLDSIIERAKKHKRYMYLVPQTDLPENTITCKKVKLVKEILD
jgi:hypothetical protein